MRARRQRGNRSDYLTDALALLSGWTQDGVQLKRVLACDESQHAALTERIKVAADTLRIRPGIRRRTVTLRSAWAPATATPSPTVRSRWPRGSRTSTGRWPARDHIGYAKLSPSLVRNGSSSTGVGSGVSVTEPSAARLQLVPLRSRGRPPPRPARCRGRPARPRRRSRTRPERAVADQLVHRRPALLLAVVVHAVAVRQPAQPVGEAAQRPARSCRCCRRRASRSSRPRRRPAPRRPATPRAGSRPGRAPARPRTGSPRCRRRPRSRPGSSRWPRMSVDVRHREQLQVRRAEPGAARTPRRGRRSAPPGRRSPGCSSRSWAVAGAGQFGGEVVDRPGPQVEAARSSPRSKPALVARMVGASAVTAAIMAHASAVSRTRSAARSMAAVRCSGSPSTRANAASTRSRNRGGAPGSAAAAATAPFSLISHRPAAPCSACAHTPTSRNRQPATYAASPRETALRAIPTRKSASHSPATKALGQRGRIDPGASLQRGQLAGRVGQDHAQGHFTGVREVRHAQRMSGLAVERVPALSRRPATPARPGRGRGRSSPPPTPSTVSQPPPSTHGPHSPGSVTRAPGPATSRASVAEGVDVERPPVVEAEVGVGLRGVRAARARLPPSTTPTTPGTSVSRRGQLDQALVAQRHRGIVPQRRRGACRFRQPSADQAGRAPDRPDPPGSSR